MRKKINLFFLVACFLGGSGSFSSAEERWKPMKNKEIVERVIKGRDGLVNRENLYRVAWLKKAGCSDKEIQEQHLPLTQEEVWVKWHNSSHIQDTSNNHINTMTLSYNETLLSYREELYLLPCVEIQEGEMMECSKKHLE